MIADEHGDCFGSYQEQLVDATREILRLEERILRIRKVCEASQDVEGELTLDGNGVNSSEACSTLRWVMKVLDGEKTQEYWYKNEDT